MKFGWICYYKRPSSWYSSRLIIYECQIYDSTKSCVNDLHLFQTRKKRLLRIIYSIFFKIKQTLKLFLYFVIYIYCIQHAAHSMYSIQPRGNKRTRGHQRPTGPLRRFSPTSHSEFTSPNKSWTSPNKWEIYLIKPHFDQIGTVNVPQRLWSLTAVVFGFWKNQARGWWESSEWAGVELVPPVLLIPPWYSIQQHYSRKLL